MSRLITSYQKRAKLFLPHQSNSTARKERCAPLSRSGDGVAIVDCVLAHTRVDGVGLNVERHGSVGAEPPTASSEQHPCTVDDRAPARASACVVVAVADATCGATWVMVVIMRFLQHTPSADSAIVGRCGSVD